LAPLPHHVVALLSPQAATPWLRRTLLPTPASRPPVGPAWIHEIKHDGYRMIVRKKDDRVRLFTRRAYDWTDRYPLIREAVTSLRPSALVLDGEAVCCDPDGTANFERLHSRAHDDRVFLYAFDLLELGGIDLWPETLEERRGRLQYLLRNVTKPGIRYNEHLDGDGGTIFAQVCKLGFEGIVSKHRQSAYRACPSKAWLKVKDPSAPGVLRFKDAEP
jgi:bifunctional non-homologous end joining protein LigD